MFKGFAIFILLFFYFVNTKFSFIPIYTYQFVFAITVIYFLVNKKYFYLEEKIKPFVMVYVVVFIYLLFNYSINGFEDNTLVKTWIVFLIKSFIGVYLLVLILKVEKYSFNELVLLLQIAIFIHATLMLIYFFNADFKEWTLEYIPQGGSNINHANTYRSRGIVSSSGATLALFQSFGLLFTTFLLTIDKLNSKKVLYYGISFIVILGSIVVSGRTGLLMLPMIFLYIILLYIKDKESSKVLIKFFVILGFLLLLIGLGYYYNNIEKFSQGEISSLMNWFSREVIIKDGSIEILTLNILSKQWLFPSDLFSWILGDTSTWTVSRIKTDIGYLRTLNALGVVGSLIFYGFFVWVFKNAIKNLHDNRNKMMVLVLGIFLFITEYKEPFFGKVMISSMITLLYFSTILLKEKCEEK